MDVNLAKLRAIEADIRAGKLEAAAAALNALGSAAPLDPRIYVTGAMLARAAGNPQYEIVALQRALALAPQWPRGHLAMAKALARAGRHAEAVAAANKAVELAPQEMPTLEIAIAIANAAGDDATALRHLQSAHALRPADPAIAVALGVALGKQARYAEALGHWRTALAGNPDDPFTLAWLGMCLIGLDRKDEARAVLEHADARLPGNPTLQFYLAIARGETPPTQPGALTEGLFDAYAGRFDVELVGQLPRSSSRGGDSAVAPRGAQRERAGSRMRNGTPRRLPRSHRGSVRRQSRQSMMRAGSLSSLGWRCARDRVRLSPAEHTAT